MTDDLCPICRRPYSAGPCRVTSAVAVVLAAVFVACALNACRPNLPPVSGCTPGASACERDRPVTCSASQRWTPAGDRDFRSVGGVCVVGDSGIAHCGAPPRDAGAEAAEVTP